MWVLPHSKTKKFPVRVTPLVRCSHARHSIPTRALGHSLDHSQLLAFELNQPAKLSIMDSISSPTSAHTIGRDCRCDRDHNVFASAAREQVFLPSARCRRQTFRRSRSQGTHRNAPTHAPTHDTRHTTHDTPTHQHTNTETDATTTEQQNNNTANYKLQLHHNTVK